MTTSDAIQQLELHIDAARSAAADQNIDNAMLHVILAVAVGQKAAIFELLAIKAMIANNASAIP